jgi:hypothetical protein
VLFKFVELYKSLVPSQILNTKVEVYFRDLGFFIPGKEKTRVGGSSELPRENPCLRMIWFEFLIEHSGVPLNPDILSKPHYLVSFPESLILTSSGIVTFT